jgi:hypothetical protein
MKALGEALVGSVPSPRECWYSGRNGQSVVVAVIMARRLNCRCARGPPDVCVLALCRLMVSDEDDVHVPEPTRENRAQMLGASELRNHPCLRGRRGGDERQSDSSR